MRSRIIPKEEINFRIIFSVDIVLVSENDQSYGLPGLDDAEKIKCGINQRDCERERGGETQPIHTHTHTQGIPPILPESVSIVSITF